MYLLLGLHSFTSNVAHARHSHRQTSMGSSECLFISNIQYQQQAVQGSKYVCMYIQEKNMNICISFEQRRIITLSGVLIKGFIRLLSMSPRATPTTEKNITFIILQLLCDYLHTQIHRYIHTYPYTYIQVSVFIYSAIHVNSICILYVYLLNGINGGCLCS